MTAQDADDGRIDAVIPWVDGADPAHAARLQALLGERGGARPPSAHATRFNDAGELDFCVASILRHAPWFGTIWIVTDAQRPALLDRIAGTPLAPRVRLVDHREAFAGFERHLPTFNSRSISAVLWRIEGLAERFVYFNDDFMLLRDVAPTDFFRDGGVVLRGAWRPQSAHSWLRRTAAAWKSLRGQPPERGTSERHAQELSARLAGIDRRYYALQHNPYPFRRATLQAYFEAHPDVLEDGVRHRLRALDQFRAESLATHLEIAQGTAILDNRLHVVELKPRQQSPARVRRRMAAADRDASAAFACVQSLERAAPALQAQIVDWLRRRIGPPL